MNEQYHYIRTEKNLWTVGTGDPGKLIEVTEFGYCYSKGANFNAESDHDSPEKAAARVAFLNGGGDPGTDDLNDRITELETINAELLKALEDILKVANVRIDDPRIAQFDKGREVVNKARVQS